ncbi:sensor histidine kinase BtsS [Clostridiales bacterium]|nr:sensor histidine kinase BtsS [Clostridiales bacterium]
MEVWERMKKVIRNRLKLNGRRMELGRLIWMSFTATAVVVSIFMGLSFHGRFMQQTRETLRQENKNLMEQAGYQFQSYIRNVMKASDSLYYSVIKGTDIDDKSVYDAFQLIYNTNKDTIQRIALFAEDGELLTAAPLGKVRANVDIHREEWYRKTLAREENITFGQLAVERIFESSPEEYTRIVPMTRVVQLNSGDDMEKGILLIQLKQSSFKDIFSDLLLGEGSYLYLTDSDGNLLYHPRQELVESGIIKEQNPTEAIEANISMRIKGSAKEEYFVSTVGYVGWKIVGVMSSSAISLNSFQSSMMILFLLMFFLSVMVFINSFVSSRVSAPIKKLEEAVNQIEAGDLETKIQPSGFYEVWHLGTAINQMQENLKRLMADIVEEHEAKRRRELIALQNQINPHFLYNTLDIIVWMIENEKREEAVEAVTALARFFRISLSNGKNIITVGDEIKHVRSYLMIQEMRFKNRFTYYFDVDEKVKICGTIKLILQPIVENSIYHAMEFMAGDGEIHITVRQSGGDIIFLIEDNGCGMPSEMVRKIMTGESVSCGKGGVGLQNVQERLQLVFGKEYGLSLSSEQDEGTKVWIKIPAINYETLSKRGLD